ncbi:MAG: ATP-binding protein [Bacteroidales bacterium]|nr:ATP-binding protein [Bacteroidales bacterium]MDT8431680.1 ATP-binding protein [Bacteroidales bacterium]
MVYKQFRVNVIIRVLLLTVSCLLLFLTLNSTFIFTPVLIIGLVVYQVWSMIRYVDRTNRELTNFLESIRYSEFTRTFAFKEAGSSFEALSEAFNEVMHDFQQVRSEKEEHLHYLHSIVQNLDISILVYQRNGIVEMINPAAKKLFQVNTLKNIHKLETLSKELVDTLLAIQPGENHLVKVQDDDDILQLAIQSTEFKVKHKTIMLTTVKNIQNVLEGQETEAWQKLIRVLTHEIMNSIAPISSLSATIELMIKEYDAKSEDAPHFDREAVDEIQQALQTINKRSTGLMNFVETYRSLTKIPKPNFAMVDMNNLLENVVTLMKKETENQGIRMHYTMEPGSIELQIDEQMISQVLINLIKNSVHALEGKENGEILIRGYYNKRGRPTVQIIDNGQGILPDVLDKIFIPFFTTKRQGSGIGLSLSRQILRLHGGTITAQSVPDNETIFSLTF